jgi:3-hydroxyacyl-CoA dehydrogenase/enoyl-CoA hydratase/3-hydroxybutyryl-CoA epimerase
METLRYHLAADGILTITFDAPDAAVNTMTLAWQHDLAAAAAQAVADKERIRGVLLASAKPTFFAGAALKSVLSLEAKDAAAGFAEIRALTTSYRTLESLCSPARRSAAAGKSR